MKHFYNLISLPKKITSCVKNLALGVALLSAGNISVKSQIWTINVCSGMPGSTQSNTYGPMYTTATANATNRLTSIYPSSQLTGIASQTLTSIYFHTGAGNAGGILGTPNLKVYLKEVSNLDWGSGALDWATASTGATLVFDGNPAPFVGTTGGWKQIPLSTTFAYSGTQNLALFVEYKNPTASNAVSWSYEYTSPCVSGSSSGLETKYSNNTTGTLPTSLASTNSRRPYIGFDYPVPCPAPTNIVTSAVTQNSVNISWVAGGSETSWDYSIQAAGAGVPTTFTNSTTNTLNPTTLIPNTNYEFYVRAACGGTNGNSLWKGPYTFKTLCGPATSMFENFDSYATGNIVPDCWARIVGGSNTAQTISSATPASGTRNLYQVTSSAANATVVVLPEFSNINAGTHWLRFKARTTVAPGSLDVGYVTNIADASTFVNIQTLNILNTSYTAQDAEYSVIVPSSVPANARLAIRNSGTSTAGHYYDDVYWEAKPSCIAPANIVTSNITSNSVNLQWNASVSTPANGYDIYVSTNNVAPTSSTTPTLTGVTSTSQLVGSLSPASSYYVWIRSRCSATDFSSWSTQIVTFYTNCQAPVITSTTGATVCPNQPAALSATAGSAVMNWYSASSGGTSLATGNTFNTPSLSTSTDYWVSAATPTTGYIGLPAPISTSGNSGVASLGLIFDALKPMTIETVDVYPMHATNTSGTITIELKDASNATLQTITANVTVSVAGALNTVPLNFAVPAGTGYKLVVTGKSATISNFLRESETSNFNYPYTFPSVCVITGSTTTGYYYYLYNWKIASACESARTMVTATVDTNCLSTSEIDKKDSVKVYPNPFSEFITINKYDLVKTIIISDLSGKLIKTINKPESVLRLQDLSAGMYILQLDMKDGTKQTIKVIKK